MAERIVIRELVVKLLFQGSESGVTRFNQALEAFKTLAGFAEETLAALSDAVIGTTLDISDQADALDEAAAQVGITAQAYDALAAAVALNGASTSELDAGLRTLSGTLEEFVRTGKGSGADAFKVILGPNARQRLSEVKSVDEGLGLLADGLAQVKDPIRQVALANDFLGRSGNKLLPTLQGGSEGLAAMLEQAQRLGTFTPQLIEDSSRLQDGLAGLSLRARGLKISLGTETVPAMADLVEEISLAVDGLREAFAPEIQSGARMLASVFRFVRDAVKAFRESLPELRAELEQAVRFTAIFALVLAAVSGVLYGGAVIAAIKAATLAVSAFVAAETAAIAPLLIVIAILGTATWAFYSLARGLQEGDVMAVALSGTILALGARSLPLLIQQFVIFGNTALGAWLKATAPLILLLALVGVIALAIEDLVSYVQGGDSAFGRLLEKMKTASPTLASFAEALRLLFGGGLGEALFDAFDALEKNASDLIARLKSGILAIPEALKTALKTLGDAIPDVIKRLGEGLGAIPGAFVEAGRSLANGGRSTQVQVGGSTTQVTVQAAADPRATGVAVAQHVDEAQNKHATRVARDLKSAMAY